MRAASERASSCHRSEHGQPANTFRVSMDHRCRWGTPNPSGLLGVSDGSVIPSPSTAGGRNCQRYRPAFEPLLNFSTCYRAKELRRFCVSLYRSCRLVKIVATLPTDSSLQPSNLVENGADRGVWRTDGPRFRLCRLCLPAVLSRRFSRF